MVAFRYGFIAGNPGEAIPIGGGLGFPGNDFWFVSQAEADLDDDGESVIVEGYSFANHIYNDSPVGWD